MTEPRFAMMADLRVGDLVGFIGRPDDPADSGDWYPVVAVEAGEWFWYDTAAESDPEPNLIRLRITLTRRIRRIPAGAW